MAIPDHRPAGADLWERYARLPPELKLVLRLKSLIWLPTGKGQFLECLTRSGSRAPEGRAWASRCLNDVLDDLFRLGLLTEELACAPALLFRVAVDAAGCDDGGALIAAVGRSFPCLRNMGYYYGSARQVDCDALQRLIWLAIHANDAPGFVDNSVLSAKTCAASSTAQSLAALIIATPLAPDWLAGRAPVIQAALVATKLSALLQGGVPAPDLPVLIANARTWRGREGFAGIGSALLQYDLLAGRLEEVRRGIDGLDNATGAQRLAMEGVVAFLEDHNATALERFRTALKVRRKAAGKRKVFLDGVCGVFFLMALLRADDAALQAEIQAGIDTALSSGPPHASAVLALQALLWLTQGLEPKARELLGRLRATMPAEPLAAACIGLAEFALDAKLARAHAAELAARFERWREALPLIARMHAEILVEVAPEPGPYRDYLARTGQGVEISFTRLIRTQQPWERALESLDAFLGAGSPKPSEPSPRKTKRLVWFLDPETQEIEVAEQSAKGREGWSDGRAVALKRLHARDPRLDYLTAQDRTALCSLRKESNGWYDRDLYAFDRQRTIAALVGHPAVFDSRHRSQPLELVAYPLELVVGERRGGFHIGLSHTAKEPCVFLEAETPTRYRVVEFSQRMLAVQEILGRRGLAVPASARDRVVALVQRQNPKLPIRAEIDAVAGTALEGNAAPVVQCTKYEEGLKLSLVVRPFGAEGPAYLAGLGGRSVLASVGGQQLRANRDLSCELAERRAIIDACPTLRDRAGADAHEVLIEELEGCLEALLELRAYPGPVSVEWPQGHKFRVCLLTPDKLKLRVRQDRDWFGVDGTVALDEDQVLEMRFLLDRLARAQGRFVPLEDGSFVALTRQLQAQLQRLEAVSEPHRSGRRVHALGAPALETVLGEAGEVRADAAWTRHVAWIRAAERWTPVLPPGLQAELRDYQLEGFAWLSRLARWGAGACLADDMGLGKTVQAIAVMLERAAEGPCLVVAPTSVCPNWEAEIVRFAPTLATHRLAAAGERAALIAGLGAGDVLICSYGLLHQEAEALAARSWQMVVLDEAQAIKNAQTKRAQASLALQAGFRLALTGTPVENYLDELWSLFNFVNPGLLGSREGFQKRFAVPIERDHDAHARQALRTLIRPFLLRRTKGAVLSELPPRTEQTVNVEMDSAERAFYEALRQRAVENIAALDAPPGKRKMQILAEITRLRRACCSPALIDAAAGVPSGKLDAFLDLVQDLVRNRHRALVFSQFVGHLALVRTALDEREISYEYLDGGTPGAERERRVAAFQSGSAALFLISLRAGGTGLNLTAADYVLHLDPWWNPAVEDQASDRAHRIGQERPVTIYRLIMQDSIEERIVQLHRDKRDLASDLLQGAETAGRLSEEALLDLIRA